jgi:hypothetical protein
MMTPKERMRAALDFTGPDRVPIGETGIDYTITEAALGRPTLYRAKWREYQALWEGRRDEFVESCKRDLVALARYFEHDFVPVFPVPPRGRPVARPEFLAEYTWRTPDGRVYRYSPHSEGHAFLVDAPEVTLDDLEDRVVELDTSELEVVRHVVAELGETHFILGRLPSGLFPLGKYPIERLLVGMIDQPALIHRIIEVEAGASYQVAAQLLDAGCDGIIELDDVAGNDGPFMSPRMFREFIFPHLKAFCDLAHSRGKYFVKHTDGNMWPLLDMLVEAGVDGWHGIQPSIGMTLPRLQERYGGRFCFFGGVDLDTLIRGTPEAIEREVQTAVESAPPQGGLVLTSSNTLMVGVPFENYLTMREAARRYGGR